MAEDLRALLAQATQELGLNVPICCYEKDGTGLKLWPYGHKSGDRPITWKPKAKRTRKTVKKENE